MTKIIENIYETKSKLIENISKMDKPLARLVKKNESERKNK